MKCKMTLILRTISLVFVVSILVLSSAYAGKMRSVDPRTFDICGVKIGMDYDQALAAVAQHFRVARSEIKPYSWLSENSITGTKFPGGFAYEKGGVRLHVRFVPRIPLDKVRPLVVHRVFYGIPDTQENRAAMRNAAVAKYGTPSSDVFEAIEWCTDHNLVMKTCHPYQAILRITGISMELHDPELERVWEEAEKKYLDSLKVTKPNF